MQYRKEKRSLASSLNISNMNICPGNIILIPNNISIQNILFFYHNNDIPYLSESFFLSEQDMRS